MGSRAGRVASWVWVACLVAGLAGGPAAARPASIPPMDDPGLQRRWEEGLALERREQLLESSRHYRAIAAARPDSAFIRWRLARNHWRYAERLPQDDKVGRLHHFGLANHWADAALAVDPECGECVLWKVAALGRLATTQGVLTAAGQASTIAELIDRGIALQPSYADNERNVTLANLYYAGSAFYRVVPDWFWLGLVIGVRGDKHRALDYIQRAIEISGARVDYQVELGAVLLCIGTQEDDPTRIEAGREVLRNAMAIEDFQSTDGFDREHARILVREPQRACGYSRDGWIDLSEAARAR